MKNGKPNAIRHAKQEVSKIIESERSEIYLADVKCLKTNPFQENSVDFLIVTGLAYELAMFKDVFKPYGRWESSDYNCEYYFADIDSETRSYSIALVSGRDMGNIYSSQATFAGVADLDPAVVISAGIGYTLNPAKLKLGDIHVTNQVIHWSWTAKEHGVQGRKTRPRIMPVGVDNILRQIVDYIKGVKLGQVSYRDWVEETKKRQPKVAREKVNEVLQKIDKSLKCGIPGDYYSYRCNVESGNIVVSDDSVIASVKAIKARSLFENFMSGEMEAAGVASAINVHKSHREFVAIRGICDFGYGKEALEQSSDAFRRIAAMRVASFITELAKGV